MDEDDIFAELQALKFDDDEFDEGLGAGGVGDVLDDTRAGGAPASAALDFLTERRAVGSQFFNHIQLYDDLAWEHVRLHEHLVLPAPSGGPVAVLPASRGGHKFLAPGLAMTGPSATRPLGVNQAFRLRIFTSAGALIAAGTVAEFEVDGLVCAGWTDDLMLVFVEKRGGAVHVYDLECELVASFHVVSPSHDVLSCFLWGSGLVARTVDHTFWALLDFETQTRIPLANGEPVLDVQCFSVVPPHQTHDRSVKAIVATGDYSGLDTLYVMDANSLSAQNVSALEQPIPVFDRMAVSPDGTNVACITTIFEQKLTVYIFSSSFIECHCQVTLHTETVRSVPSTLVWCGPGAVAIIFSPSGQDTSGLLALVTLDGSFSKSVVLPGQLDGRVAPVAEVDGLRFFSRSVCHFLYPIDPLLASVCQCDNDALLNAAMASHAAPATSPKHDAESRRMSVAARNRAATRAASVISANSFALDSGEAPGDRIALEAASWLFLAGVAYADKSPTAHDFLNRIHAAYWTVAIDLCIEVAHFACFDKRLQVALLRAASLGVALQPREGAAVRCDPIDLREVNHRLAKASRYLRVVNSVADRDVGIPITAQQLEARGAASLVDSLVQRKLHLWAFRVCGELGVSPAPVLVHWASCKVRAADPSKSDRELAQEIHQRIDSAEAGGLVSYAEVARTAYHVGRRDLAQRLLIREPRPDDRVPLLLSQQQFEAALMEALSSGDMDLVVMTLLHIRRVQGEMRVLALLDVQHRNPARQEMIKQAWQVLALYCRQVGDRDFVNVISQVRSYTEPATLRSRWDYADALAAADPKKLAYAHRLFATTGEMMNAQTHSRKQGKGCIGDFCAEQSRTQARLHEIIARNPDMNAREIRSAADLVEWLVEQDQDAQAEAVRKEFGFSDEEFSVLRIRVLAQNGLWERLRQIPRSKNNIEPFIQACRNYGSDDEAVWYIMQLPQHRKQIELLMQMNRRDEALAVAQSNNDTDAVRMIRSYIG